MKATLYFPGERAAGIRDSYCELEIKDFSLKQLESFGQDVEDFRKDLKEFAEKYIGDNCQVLLEGECPDCGWERDEMEHTCPNPNCISNMPEEFEFDYSNPER